MIDLSDITIEVVENDGKVGTFSIGPLPKGYGPTFANPLRRVLLSSLYGGAVTSMRIAGIDHEYSTLKGVKETVVEIQMNVKGIRFSCESNEPQVVRVKKKGKGEITAADLELTESVTVMDPGAKIATITDAGTTFDMELVVERGVGYRTADEELRSEVGRLPLHADFSPIERVTFSIDKTRKGEKLDLDQISLKIMTDGSVDPQEALGKAAEILQVAFGKMMDLTGVEEEPMPVESEEPEEGAKVEAREWLVEDLPISKRAKSRLIEADMTKLGDIVAKSRDELLEIKGFGEAALDEVVEVLNEYGLKLKE
jgi:DNA-directed RNA polymerase subunit alpha